MTVPPTARILNGATSQADRLAGGPDPGTVAIDGRNIADLLAFVGRFAGLVRFWDGNDREAGSWAPFFTGDPAVAEAMHAVLDLDQAELTLHAALEAVGTAEGGHARAAAFDRVEKLLAHLLTVRDRSDAVATPLRGHGERRPAERLDLLEDLAATLLDELRRGQADARAALAASLGSRGHAPHVALFAAFAALFAEATGALNAVPQRLVDFYYREVLRQHRLEASPDRVFLCFTPADPKRDASVSRGARFPAGADAAGRPIVYAATTALEVRPASVTGLSVHRLTDADQASPGPIGVLSGEVASDPAQPGGFAPFPMFGAGRTGAYGPLVLQDATMAFSVASPTLMLTGGRRSVSIGLVIASTEAAPAPAADAEAHAASVAETIGAAFELFFSTAGGWVAAEGFTVTPAAEPGGAGTLYTIAFALPADAPPLIAATAEPSPDDAKPTLPADAFATLGDLPTVVARLKPGDVIAAAWKELGRAAAMAHLSVADVRIDVGVTGLTGLSVSTSQGSVDAQHDFAPFGLPAKSAATLSIAAPELFVKAPTSLSVAIDWSGLPVGATGFAGHYRDYVLDPDGRVSPTRLFDNAAFQVALSVDNPGTWTVGGDLLPLFATDPANGPPQPAAPLLRRSTLAATVAPADKPPAYYKPEAGALRVTLVSPAYAFGDTLYAANLHRAAQVAPEPAPPGSAAKLAALAQVNATAPDRRLAHRLAPAAERAVLSLSGEAAAALRQAIGPGEGEATLRAGLDLAIAAVAGRTGPAILLRLLGRAAPADLDAVPAAIERWLAEHADRLSADAGDLLARARQRLATARAIATAPIAADRPADTRVAMAAAIGPRPRASGTLPNPPWTPIAAALSVDYAASCRIRPGCPADADGRFDRIAPFDKLAPAGEDGDAVSLLAPVDPDPALFIELTDPGPEVSLLFVLGAGAQGWWDQPQLSWEQHGRGRWRAVTVRRDGTHGLTDSGIVTLALHPPDPGKTTTRLRVRVTGPADRAPIVEAVIANALEAEWIGPGGEDTRGTPLPAGSITKGETPLANIGTIAQPMQSIGGRPPAVRDAFGRWMAERLRHKGVAIDGWDHARLALEEAPSLWQAVAVPATDAATGRAAPGRVWLMVVAGPDTPGVLDPAVPGVGPATLASLRDMLAARVGPFAQVTVTNPPYLRLQVTARCLFTAENTPEYCERALARELVRWLSPWPPADLGPRPPDYYTRHAVTEFIRGRPYVEATLFVRVAPEQEAAGIGYYYFTSAATHVVEAARHADLAAA